MTKKHAAREKTPTPMTTSSVASAPAAAPVKIPSKRSRLIRYSLYALVIPIALAVRYWLAGPDVPLPALAGLDPALVEDIENARAVVWSSPRQPEKWGQLGMLLAAHSFTAEALQCFERAEVLEPSHWRWPYLRCVAQERGDPSAALDALREAAVLAGDDEPLPRLLLVERLLEIGELDEAERHVQFALHNWPRHPRANLDAARLRMVRDDAEGAVALLHESPMDDTHTRRTAHQLAAQIHRMLGQELAASATIERLKQLPPDEAWTDPWREKLESYRTTKGAYIARIDELRRRGDQPRLDRAVLESIGRYPELAHLVEGRRLLAEGDAEAAESALREAATLDPRSIDALISLGEALKQQRKLGDAEDVFRRATQVEPTNGGTHLHLGHCLYQQSQYLRAIDSLHLAVQLLPTVPEAHMALANALEAAGKAEEAEEQRRIAKRLAPSSAAGGSPGETKLRPPGDGRSPPEPSPQGREPKEM
jgi:tetratricopeptide (TPR) repeat protein